MPKVSAEHSEARRQQILDAALQCFSKHGFHVTTMKDIMKASGLSAGAIYNYFSSKAEIVDAIARDRHANERSVLSGAFAESEKRLDLHGLARAFFGSFAAREHREARRVGVEMWAEALRNPDVLESVRRGVDEPRQLLAQIIRECQEEGELPSEIDPEGLARVTIAIFQGFVLQQAWDPDVDIEQYVAAVDVLLAALSAYQRD